MKNDEFLTVKNTGEGLYKEKGSKFYGFIFHVKTEDEVKEKLEQVKSKYHDARHHCYAYRLNPEGDLFRMNDDGEPSSTAGKPIYGQILANNLTNVLIVVVRYFGGTKLGTSGLIRAYKTTAEEAIAKTKIIKKTVLELYQIVFEYDMMNDIMKILHEEEIEPIEKIFEANCTFVLGIRKSKEEQIINRLSKVKNLKTNKLNKKINF